MLNGLFCYRSDLQYRYKAGTARFESWLAQVGQRCGANIEDIATTTSSEPLRDKKTDCKTTKPNAVNYIIPIRQFVGLAKAIAASTAPKVVVPWYISTLLVDVISLRKNSFASFRWSSGMRARG